VMAQAIKINAQTYAHGQIEAARCAALCA